MPTVYCTSFDSRIGHVYVASTDRGVCKICIPRETKKDFFRWVRRHFSDDEVVEDRAKNRGIIDDLEQYVEGKLSKFRSAPDEIGTVFQTRVWRELRKIPYGTTITYKQLARRVGIPKGYQAVGRAVASNPLPIVIPCHRVLGSDGRLTGYAAGIKTKEFLLRLEGALIL
jgi:methylated-DNA-[protein]-cysteine S-methyltransferase